MYKSIHHNAVDGVVTISLRILCVSWVVFVDVVLKKTPAYSHPPWSGRLLLFVEFMKFNFFIFFGGGGI